MTNKYAKALTVIAMFMGACSNYACAFSPIETALGVGIFNGLGNVFSALFYIFLCGLLIKAFGVFGYIFSLVLVFMSIYL